jgi:hypothetical protein
MNPLVSPEGESDQNPWADYAFDTMPRDFIEKWRLMGKNGKPYLTAKQKEAGQSPSLSSGLLCPHSFPARMERWLSKVGNHPFCYRVDGVNIDTLVGFTRPGYYFGGCFSEDHPADYRDYINSLAEMCKVAYDRGLMVGHEGNAFWLEKYCLSSYGKGMVSVGLYTGWYLKPTGASKDPEKVISMVAQHVPINALVYHDQIAIRLHDAEALNIRFSSRDEYDTIRRFKLTFSALYGLTPNLHFAGIDADRLVLEDIAWMEKEIPRAQKTYEELYGLRITDHRFLTQDRMIQRTVFDDRIHVVANFTAEPFVVEGRSVPGLDYVMIKE